MADAYTVSRPGQADNTGDALALFLKVFPGEVLTAFDEHNVMMPLHSTRTIASGKSAQFPATAKATASYHVPGNEITGTQIAGNEVVVNIDNILQSNVFVSKFDEAMSAWDARAEYARLLGMALAKEADENILIAGLLGARASATVTGGNGGSQVTNASAKTDGTVLAGLISDAAEDFDERDVPATDRYVALKPAQYRLLAQTTGVMNRDWGGNGSYSAGQAPDVGGVMPVKTNNLASTNITASPTGANNTYHGDFSTTAALVWHPSGIGTVKLLDVTTEKDYQLHRLGTLIVAHYAMGHKSLRPESCTEIATA